MADGNQRTDAGPASRCARPRSWMVCRPVRSGHRRWNLACDRRSWRPTSRRRWQAAVTHPDTLCQRAQHALGLAGIGSRIAPDHTAIGVYAAHARPRHPARSPLVLEGRALLWCGVPCPIRGDPGVDCRGDRSHASSAHAITSLDLAARLLRSLAWRRTSRACDYAPRIMTMQSLSHAASGDRAAACNTPRCCASPIVAL